MRGRICRMIKKTDSTRLDNESFLSGQNSEYVESLHSIYDTDPSKVESSWRTYFDGLKEKKEPIASENISRENARRSIVLANSVPAGYKIKESDLTQKRPGTGICPSNWDDVIGTRTLRNLKEDHILLWKDIEKRK